MTIANPRPGRSYRTLLPVVFLLAATVCYWRFHIWMPEVFFGDDLVNLRIFRFGDLADQFRAVPNPDHFQRFRPVLSIVMWLEYLLFKTHLEAYQWVNIALHALTGTLVAMIAFRLSRSQIAVALAAALAFAASRFGLYQVTQTTGIVEGLSLFFAVVVIAAVLRADDDDAEAARWMWVAVGALFLAVNVHERYLAVAPWLAVAVLVAPAMRRQPLRQRVSLVIACVAVVASNVLYKAIVLDSPVLIGTGGKRIDVDHGRTLNQALDAFSSVAGLNSGPEYLVGASFTALPQLIIWTLALALISAWGFIVLVGSFRALTQASSMRSRLEVVRIPILLLCLGACLLVPPIMTIRLEQRWLLAPLCIALFILAWCAGRWSGRVIPGALAIVVAIASITIDSTIEPYFEKIFFVSSGRLASAIRRDLKLPGLAEATDIIVIPPPQECDWTLQGKIFFDLYDRREPPTRCFRSLSAALEGSDGKTERVFGVTSPPYHLVEITAQIKKERAARARKTVFSFLEAFPQGHISSDARVDTPTGRGVLNLMWDTLLGHRSSLTLISGFSYRFDDVAIESGTELDFGVSMIFPTAAPARAFVLVQEEGKKPITVYSEVLVPPVSAGKVPFEARTVMLESFAGKRVSLTFGADTPGGDSSGHWIGFTNPRLARSFSEKH